MVATIRSEFMVLQQSVSAGPVEWRFALRERSDGRSFLRLDVVELETVREKERIRASFIVASSGDLTRC